MTIKLFILALFFISALTKGIWIMPEQDHQVGTVDFFTSLIQKFPDFVIISYDDPAAFLESYQNAATAGYKSIHLSLWIEDSIQKESLPENFTGRVWMTGNMNDYPYSQIVTKVESLASEGLNVGMMVGRFKSSGFVPSIVSSLPLAWIYGPEPWTPFAGWNCPWGTVDYYSDPEVPWVLSPINVKVGCI